MSNTHNFHDINKFPKEYRIVVFPISITRAENRTGQDPSECIEHISYFSPDKVAVPKIGLNFIYADFLYFHSKEQASVLKKKFMHSVLNHKNAMQKLLNKEHQQFQIQHVFSHQVWNQLYLSNEGDFATDFSDFKKIYESDEKFQQYSKEDSKFAHRELDENQINPFNLEVPENPYQNHSYNLTAKKTNRCLGR
jgi:hypothetical protein